MDQAKQILSEKTAVLDQIGDKIPPLKDFAKKQGINSGLPVGIALMVLCFIMLIVQGKEIFVLLVTVIYPSLNSIRAIDSNDEDDDKVWLTYWMIFGLFHVLETFFGFILYFIPYWSWIKIAFFTYLLLPQTNGVATIYNTVIKKFLSENKELIRRLQKEAKEMTETISTQIDSVKDEAMKKATDPTLIAQGLSVASNIQAAAAEAEVNETAPQE